MGCYDILPSQPPPPPAAAAATTAAAAVALNNSSSTCILWTGEEGGKLVQQYQQYLQSQLHHPSIGNGSFADGAAHPADRYNDGCDVEQPAGLSETGFRRQQSTTAAALAGLRRNSLTRAGLGSGISSSKQQQQQHLHKGSGGSSSGSSSHRVAAVRRPHGWWQQLTRGLFGIGVVEEEPLHADR
jgi:hypothetical protein